MELFNYKDNCRLCLKRHTGFMKNIFTCCLEGYQDTLVQNVFALFKVELNPHKDYPQFVCRKCLTELENILLFQEDLQNNQEFLLGLFRAAYPSYIEKDFQTVHCSKECGNKFKSIAVNTDPWIDVEDPGDSEYVRVPVNFLKQFSPQVNLQRFNKASCVNTKPPKIKEENIQVDSLRSDKELSVNICKYCRKVFRSQVLVNTHYKEVHKLETGQEKNETRSKTSKGAQKSSGKIKNEKDKVLFTNLLELPAEQITSPQMDFQNNNTADIKEEFCDSPSNQQVDEILTEPVFQEKQAFLQNFNLIAKQEAALLKIKQKALQSLPRSSNFKKQMKILKKRLSKPLKSKNKLIVKPLQRCVQNKRTEKEILCRSVEFLKRYGWRKLKSSSRRGTPISNDRINLFEKTLASKSISRKVSTKNSSSVLKENSQLVQKVGGSKMAIQNKGCESKGTHIPVNIKKRNSAESLKNQRLEKVVTCQSQTSGTSSFKKLTTCSKISNRNSAKRLNITLDDMENTKLDLVIKSEPLTEFSIIKDDDKSEELAALSSKSFYSDSMPTKPVTGKRVIGDKRITDQRVAKTTSLEHLDPCKDIKHEFNSSKTKLPYDSFKHEELQDNHDREPHVECKEIDVKLKLFGSNDIESFHPTDDFQVKKELRIQLERDRSPVKFNGFNGSLVDENNFDISGQKLDISQIGDARSYSAEFSRKKGRPRNTVTTLSTNHINFALPSCSTSNNVLLPKKRGRSLKNLAKESLTLNATNDSKLLKFDNWLNKTTQPHETLAVVTRKPGRPKNCPPTREAKMVQLSTLQDLTERFEKDDNVGLRMKLRKTASCESLNSLKYDTQELDENFQIKVEAMDQSKDLKGVPDNKSWFSHDRLISNDVAGVFLKDKQVSHEKVVNIDLEDEEVQMVVLISDNEEDVDFDNDTSSVIDAYINSKRRGLDSEQRESKYGLRVDDGTLYASVNDESDDVVKKEQKYRSQTSLPLSKPKLSKNISSHSFISDKMRFTETTPVKRKGRPPNKFSPALYTAKRLKSTGELRKRNLNNSHIGLMEKTIKSRSSSTSQPETNSSCVKELFNEARKRGRPKKEECQVVIGKSSSPKKCLLQKKEDISTSKKLVHSRVSSRNSFNSFPRSFIEQ